MMDFLKGILSDRHLHPRVRRALQRLGNTRFGVKNIFQIKNSWILTPAQITVNQNDYNPPNLYDSSTLFLTSSGSKTITGIVAPPIDQPGYRITIYNGGSQNITLSNQDAGSQAANQFLFSQGSVLLLPNTSIEVQYDPVNTVWRNTAISQGVYPTAGLPLPALTNDNFWMGNGSNVATAVQFSGDFTVANTGAATMATVNANVGTFNNLTVNAKGLVTAATNVSYLTANQNITISGDGSGSGSTAITLTLATVNSNVGTFTSVTVNGKGLVTAATNPGFLTGNQTITLTGDTTGSGATAITTTSTIYAVTTATYGGTTTFALSTAALKQKVTLTGNSTLALSGDVDGMVFYITIKQGGLGSFTVTWWSHILWPAGTVPTLTTTAGKSDDFIFIRISSTEYHGFILGQNI